TCITPRTLRELISEGLKTMVIKSAHNINTLLKTTVNEPIFITSRSEDDITRETEGVIAVVKNMSLYNNRQSLDNDEYEITTARVQFELINVAKVKDITRSVEDKRLNVDIDRVTYYRIS
ncbi:MAG TPA: DUF473 family protein, partial [Candidatus Methanofastidiosa archaeon]|nr:DUF473 family protein [Candidatus Methanofastidiosa archaeon]